MGDRAAGAGLGARKAFRRLLPRARARLSLATRGLGQFVYGMAVYDMVREVERERASLQQLFFALTFGEIAGLPITPGCHGLRLLPHVVPGLVAWRRGVSRERDLLDLCSEELD